MSIKSKKILLTTLSSKTIRFNLSRTFIRAILFSVIKKDGLKLPAGRNYGVFGHRNYSLKNFLIIADINIGQYLSIFRDFE
jgi:hypothetical protein